MCEGSSAKELTHNSAEAPPATRGCHPGTALYFVSVHIYGVVALSISAVMIQMASAEKESGMN